MGTKIGFGFANTVQTNRNVSLSTRSSTRVTLQVTRALRLLRTYSSQTTRRKISKKFGKRVIERGYPAAIVGKYLSEVKFADRKQPLTTETNPPVKKKKKTTTFRYTKSIPPNVT